MKHENDYQSPLIIISNDDGYQWKGIKELTALARQWGDVMVVAPEFHQSGMSNAITFSNPLRAKLVVDEPGLQVYAVNGTPTDCAKLAICTLAPRRPSLLLSGINHGHNAGTSTIYSGTIGVALEGAMHQIPSIGFSLNDYDPDADFTYALRVANDIIGRVLRQGLPHGVCLNVNVPKGEIKGVKATVAAFGRWEKEYKQRIDPRGRPYYWLGGEYVNEMEGDPTTDMYWMDRGYAAVTPCQVDQTAHEALGEIEDLLK